MLVKGIHTHSSHETSSTDTMLSMLQVLICCAIISGRGWTIESDNFTGDLYLTLTN